MTNPMNAPDRAELGAALSDVLREAERYLAELDASPVRHANSQAAAESFVEPLPATGQGAAETLRMLIERGPAATIASGGPRFFHFVCGGATPAALGADWLASLYDQIASTWHTSPLAVQLEQVSLAWLADLFGLGGDFSGVTTTGATMANFTALAAARQWWGGRHGVDVAQVGLGGLPTPPVFSSGYLHASSVKALAMLGIGRQAVRRFAADATGRLDLAAFEQALVDLDGAPAIVVANAGEVNSGAFDPIDAMAELARRHGAWLHVDGAFGLFAATSPRTASLCAGVERADSVTVDGHKWLNVPYDCGFAFVRDAKRLAETFTLVADYLPAPDDPAPMPSNLCPESSRRARSLSVWATLRAYGREGVRGIVENCLDLARRMADAVDAAPELERLAEVPLNIVCFRYNPGGRTDAELDEINRRLGLAVLRDGRVYLGTTQYAGQTALRPAIVNWRTRPADVDLAIAAVCDLGAQVSGEV